MYGAEDVKKLELEHSPLLNSEKLTTQVTNNGVNPIDGFTEQSIASALGLASLEASRYSQEIKDIVEWARLNGAKTMDDILYEIRYLSNILGNREGEKKIKTVARYVYLTNEKNKVQTEMERMKTNL